MRRGHELLELAPADEGDVAPDRALERRQRGGGVHRLLGRLTLEHSPQEACREGVAGAHAVHRGHRVEAGGPQHPAAVAHGRACLPESESNGGDRSHPREAFENSIGRASKIEDRLRIVRSNEEVADRGQELRQEVTRLLGGPESGAIVHVEGHGHPGARGLAARTPQHRPQVFTEGGGNAGEMEHPCLAHDRPVDFIGHELAQGRVTPVVEHTHRPWGRTVLQEVEAHAAARPADDASAVHAMAGELTDRALAPRVLRGQRGDEPGAQPEPRHRGHDVGFGAADLDVEGHGLVEALGRRRGEAQHDLTQPDQIVPHQEGIRAAVATRALKVVPSISLDYTLSSCRSGPKVTWAGWFRRAQEENPVMSIWARKRREVSSATTWKRRGMSSALYPLGDTSSGPSFSGRDRRTI